MSPEKVMELYLKERYYQKCSFGEYKDIESLNFASFILFIETYLERVKKGYSGKWSAEKPSWLTKCKEFKEGTGPIEAYEDLIKVMALAGAALETFTDINIDEWRKNAEKESLKWKK